MDNDFGVGPGAEAMSAALETSAEFGKIVDFAIEDDPRVAILIEDGLVAAAQVNDAEAAHAQTRAIRDEDAFIIRAAVDDAIAHFPHLGFSNVALAGGGDNSGDSTHLP
jgi:predicted amidohydrolase